MDVASLRLLDRVAARGNRNQRIEPASLQLLEAALQTHYAAPAGKSAATKPCSEGRGWCSQAIETWLLTLPFSSKWHLQA
jgi:hypothetical protein